MLGLLGREQAIGHAFHITSDEVLTWNQIYREAGHAVGVEPNLVHIPSDLIAAYDPEEPGSLIGDKANSAVFDNRKIKRWVPDFVATVPWSEGVRRAMAWHEADPNRCTIDDEANRVWGNMPSRCLSLRRNLPPWRWQPYSPRAANTMRCVFASMCLCAPAPTTTTEPGLTSWRVVSSVIQPSPSTTK